jgi:hypothetical protein
VGHGLMTVLLCRRRMLPSTYWPTDLNKIPDLLDFAITKDIPDIYSSIETNKKQI